MVKGNALDGLRVVGRTITLRTVILDVAEDLVVRLTESGGTGMVDSFEPESARLALQKRKRRGKKRQ